MGTPHFAIPTLEAMVAAGYNVVAVYTKPPNSGMKRGRRNIPSPVHEKADELGITVHAPDTLRRPEEAERISGYRADVVVVAAYGLLLPQNILDMPRYGCINVHGSLLPRWRGAAPVQRAIMAGDVHTGITIMKMERGLDTGPICSTSTIEIADQTCGEVMDRLAALGATMVVDHLADPSAMRFTGQENEGATYASMISKEECRLDAYRSAEDLERTIRALSPAPGAWISVGGQRMKVFAAQVVPSKGASPGLFLDDDFTIGCGTNALRLLDVQWAGRSRMKTGSMTGGSRPKSGDAVDHPENHRAGLTADASCRTLAA